MSNWSPDKQNPWFAKSFETGGKRLKKARTLTAAGSPLLSPSENPPDSAAVSVSEASAASPVVANGGASPCKADGGASLTLFDLSEAPPWA